MESRLQFHEPERFWKVFKLWGETVNIREQQDAFDFFQALIDQVDEQLKVNMPVWCLTHVTSHADELFEFLYSPPTKYRFILVSPHLSVCLFINRSICPSILFQCCNSETV